jgi:hypothetical protein
LTGEVTIEFDAPTLRLRLEGQEPISDVELPSFHQVNAMLREAARALLLRISPHVVAAYA